MANIAKWMLDLIGNPKTAKFVDTLKHSDLPKNWADDPEIVGLAERAYQQGGTDSPFFRAFEKAKGPAMRVSHGSRYGDIEEFVPSKGGEFGPGVYTGSPEMANFYAKYVSQGPDDPKIYDLFLASKNMRSIPKEDWLKWTERRTPKTIQKKLKEQGVDAIDGVELTGGHQYLAFEPTQLKSVKNRGTFNPDDPNIYRALAPVGVGLGTLAAAGMIPDTEASAKSAYINSPEMKAVMMGIRDEPVKEAWNPVEALATAPIGAFTTGARAASVGIDALLSALLGD